ncbi:MAG: DUF1523 family protein [Micavibrio sp.]|nr:MAG: DUF1523 family protein [Micavibrio sp.]
MKSKTIFVAAGAVMLTAAFAGSAAYQYGTQDQVTFTVTDKERLVARDGGSAKYLVSTRDTQGGIEVFENTDALLQWKFNSSDIQAKLEVGGTYDAQVYGWRVPFLSMYRNIVDVESVGENPQIEYSRPAPGRPGM